MPILGALLVSLFTTLGGWLVKYVSKKTALWLAVAVAIASAFAVATVVVAAAVSGLSAAAPAVVSTVLTWFIPPQLPAIVGARFAIEVAMAAYRYQLNLQLAIAASA